MNQSEHLPLTAWKAPEAVLSCQMQNTVISCIIVQYKRKNQLRSSGKSTKRNKLKNVHLRPKQLANYQSIDRVAKTLELRRILQFQRA